MSYFVFVHQGEDVRMQEIMKLAHEFLQNFCAGNQQNQVLLHKHINLFLNPGVSDTGNSALLPGIVFTILSFGKIEIHSSLFILTDSVFSPFFPTLSDPRGSHHAAHLHE